MYTHVLTDLRGNEFGELRGADERRVFLPFSRTPIASFKLEGDKPLQAELHGRDDLLLKVYNDERALKFHGPVTATEEQVEADRFAVMVTAAGPQWRLNKRLAGKSARGAEFTVATDRADIFKQLIDATNAESDTQIRTAAVSSGSTATYTAGPYRPVLECGQELADSLDGFDWTVEPIEYSGGKIGDLRVDAVRGAQRPDAVFEHGTGRNNVSGWRRQKNWDDLANAAFHSTDEGPESPLYGTRAYADAASISSLGLYEIAVDGAGIFDATLRDRLIQEHVNARKAPRQVYTLTPQPVGAPSVPRFGVDYDIGDWVPFRAKRFGATWFNGWVRVYSVTVEIDAVGKTFEKPSIVPDEDAT